MPINPNTPFTRHYVDLPTEIALKLEAAARAAGKSKKQFIADAIAAACAVNEQPQPKVRKVK